MREFIIVYMLEPVSVGTRFTMWSLHMTLLPWFNAPNLDIVREKLAQKLVRYKPFEVEVGERASFGRRKNSARLINNSPKLQSLHHTLLETVNANGWGLTGRYTGDLFKPHVTQKSGRDAVGKLLIDRLYIVEGQPQGYREIVGKVDLK